MPRRRQPGADGAVPPPPFVIEPDGIYRQGHICTALGVCVASLRREWREGRLRVVRRCGKTFLLGRDVLAWLDAGELPSPSRKARLADEPAA